MEWLYITCIHPWLAAIFAVKHWYPGPGFQTPISCFMIWGERWLFVLLISGWIIDNHCFNFLFIIMLIFYQSFQCVAVILQSHIWLLLCIINISEGRVSYNNIFFVQKSCNHREGLLWLLFVWRKVWRYQRGN